MISSQHHAELYEQLRSAVLARHFALGRYFRANHVAMQNHLGSLHNHPPAADPSTDPTPGDRDDADVSCASRHEVRPWNVYDSAAEFRNLSASEQEDERWRVVTHMRENPLMQGPYLFTALAIEYALGRKEVLPIIELGLDTLRSLYKFQPGGGHMDGYIIRWDAVTSDDWKTASGPQGTPTPVYCCEFLRGVERAADGSPRIRYEYCTPFNHPSYVAGGLRYRAWEPSADEIVGLVGTYHVLHAFVDDPAIRSAVRMQANWLGDYLAEHGYLLVRPDGGFTARGATTLCPYEFPLTRVFERITGEAYASRGSFEDVLAKAGLWECVEGTVTKATVVGVAAGSVAGATLGASLSILTGGRLPPRDFGDILGLLPLGFAFAGPVVGWICGRAAGLFFASDCFDVASEEERNAFASAYLLKWIPAELRYSVWLQGMRFLDADKNQWGRKFPTFAGGLTALLDRDMDAQVREHFVRWLPWARRSRRGWLGNSGFTTALGAALDVDGERPSLRQWLDECYERFQQLYSYPDPAQPTRSRPDLAIRDRDIEGERKVMEDVIPAWWEDENLPYLDALEYLACLAVSWWTVTHGRPTNPLFSATWPGGTQEIPGPPPTPVAWKAPSVPASAVTKGYVPALTRPAGPGPTPARRGMIDLYKDAAAARKPAEPPSAAYPFVREDVYTVTVPESAPSSIDLDTVVRADEAVEVSAGGTIWAGVLATGQNGPEGWANIDHDAKWPLPGSHPYCLLYRLVSPALSNIQTPFGSFPGHAPITGWIRLGRSLSFLLDYPVRLRFRINDDAPGNGSGAFHCTIRVHRLQ
jgi:hypothetical protein